MIDELKEIEGINVCEIEIKQEFESNIRRLILGEGNLLEGNNAIPIIKATLEEVVISNSQVTLEIEQKDQNILYKGVPNEIMQQLKNQNSPLYLLLHTIEFLKNKITEKRTAAGNIRKFSYEYELEKSRLEEQKKNSKIEEKDKERLENKKKSLDSANENLEKRSKTLEKNFTQITEEGIWLFIEKNIDSIKSYNFSPNNLIRQIEVNCQKKITQKPEENQRSIGPETMDLSAQEKDNPLLNLTRLYQNRYARYLALLASLGIGYTIYNILAPKEILQNEPAQIQKIEGLNQFSPLTNVLNSLSPAQRIILSLKERLALSADEEQKLITEITKILKSPNPEVTITRIENGGNKFLLTLEWPQNINYPDIFVGVGFKIDLPNNKSEATVTHLKRELRTEIILTLNNDYNLSSKELNDKIVWQNVIKVKDGSILRVDW